jgi:P-type conjugative transfer protein TrbJ
MKRRNFICAALGGVVYALGSFMNPHAAMAQYVVFDPSNFSQNILQAIRLLASNVNEAKMIANQIKSLAHEVKNLKKLPFDIISDFEGQLSELFSTVGSINGLMQNLSSLQSQFETLYPDFVSQSSPVPRTSIAQDIKAQILNTREVMLGAAKAGAMVLANLPKTEEQLHKLMSDSQGAVGILQAAQAGNQISATVSGNLIQLNAQLATYTQAHTAYLMEINSASAAAKNRLNHVLDNWAAPSGGKSISENPF